KPEGLGALAVAVLAFESAVNHWPLGDLAAAVGPAEGHMQHRIGGPEAFAAFGRAPHHDEAGPRNQPLDEIGGIRGRLQPVERDQPEPGLNHLGDAFTIGAAESFAHIIMLRFAHAALFLALSAAMRRLISARAASSQRDSRSKFAWSLSAAGPRWRTQCR